MSLKIVCISDTHEQENKITLPEGDILIHAGDITGQGTIQSLKKRAKWFAEQNFSKKILVAGNHDRGLESGARKEAIQLFEDAGVIYLENSEVIIENLKFYGSPITPFFHNWAFNKQRGEEISHYWKMIPEDTDVLITHGPPKNILDLIEEDFSGRDLHQGCEELAKRVKELKQLKLHVMGHIHEGYGQIQINHTLFVNASSCDGNYKPINPPIVVDIL